VYARLTPMTGAVGGVLTVCSWSISDPNRSGARDARADFS
jgi:hypothetical protein